MRIFVYEHLCAGGATGTAAASLAVEGWAMLTALLVDFGRLPGVVIDTMLRLSGAPPAAGLTLAAGVTYDFLMVEGTGEVPFRRLAGAADWTLIVAPEFDDILANRLHWVEEAGGRSLNCTPEAAMRTGDKLRLADQLRERGLPTPATACWPMASSFPAVCKPRHGAGSQATFLVRDEGELRQAVDEAATERWSDDLILQSFIPGEAVSVSFLIGPGRRLAMPAAAQHLSTDGRFHYQGGSLPLDPQRNARATRLAARAVDAVEGLAGYVGVDVVIGTAADGDAVIEINPRLTTSYVGLRALARFNLAEALLAVMAGEEPPRWEWRTDLVRFTSDGRLIGS